MADTLPTIVYKVKCTPLISENVYGDEIDISNFITIGGINQIRRSIDSGDYDVGVYTFGDISITGFNENGILNDQNDSRSIFTFLRDRAKISVEFIQIDDDGEELTTISFHGLLNEEATRQNIQTESIKMKVLSIDSVIRNTKVAAQSIVAGNDVKTAIFNILSDSRITSVLGVSLSNVNPDLNIEIDDGTKFDNKPSKEMLDQLLLISNSVMVIDSADNVIIKPRDEDTGKDVLNLFGQHDIHGRENIIKITKFNNGLHRMFTQVRVNDSAVKINVPIAQEFGLREKSLSIDFITDPIKESQIADRLMNEFKAPKVEANVSVATRLVKDVDLLDRISINYPLRIKPIAGKFLPVIGITEIGSTEEPLPRIFGSLKISDQIAFKVIEKIDNPQTFETLLKLRQIGTELNDGTFAAPGNCIVGFAVIGECILGPAGDPCETWNPSVTGGASLGCTKIA